MNVSFKMHLNQRLCALAKMSQPRKSRDSEKSGHLSWPVSPAFKYPPASLANLELASLIVTITSPVPVFKGAIYACTFTTRSGWPSIRTVDPAYSKFPPWQDVKEWKKGNMLGRTWYPHCDIPQSSGASNARILVLQTKHKQLDTGHNSIFITLHAQTVSYVSKAFMTR